MKALHTLVAVLALTAIAFSADEMKHEHGKADADKAPAKAVLKQTTCPVSGKPVKADKFVDYKGLKVYFCCDDCPAKFKKSPMTYLPAVYKQIYPQSVQVKCPVMGGAPDGKTFTEYKGQKIGFCCPDCIEKFKADPEKYMAKMKECVTSQVHCPIMGLPIDPNLSVEQDGKKIYVCCKTCVAMVKADPGKWKAMFAPEAGVLARGAKMDDDIVLCPVCAEQGGGQHKRKDVKTVQHGGKTYFMCGDSCVKAFEADPDKYVKIVEAAGSKP